jgi:hypothetical protein
VFNQFSFVHKKPLGVDAVTNGVGSNDISTG